MNELSAITFTTAFGAGIISFLSPCVLPLVPGYVSYVAGDTLTHGRHADSRLQRLSAIGLSLCFVAGFSTVFIALGAGVTAVGQMLLRYKYEANIVAGGIVILFGLFMAGALRLPWLQRDLRFHVDIKGGRPLGAYLIGVARMVGTAATAAVAEALGTAEAAGAVNTVQRSRKTQSAVRPGISIIDFSIA